MKYTDHVKEIHYRKATSYNDELVIRDYIPPQFHARQMAIAKKAAERRAVDRHTQNTDKMGRQ